MLQSSSELSTLASDTDDLRDDIEDARLLKGYPRSLVAVGGGVRGVRGETLAFDETVKPGERSGRLIFEGCDCVTAIDIPLLVSFISSAIFFG